MPTLWFENLDHLPGSVEVATLEEFGFSLPALHDDDEWVLGHRIVDATLDAPSIVYVTRKHATPGVRFDMRSAPEASARTDELHRQIKRFIVENAHGVEDMTGPTVSRTWTRIGRLVLDKAELPELNKSDVALARGYLVGRLSYTIEDLISHGFRSDVQLELTTSRSAETSNLIISVGAQGEPTRLRVWVEAGNSVVRRRINSVGIAALPLVLAEESDLISILLELHR